ncbi:hypothetical protein CK203_097967 [Vitis vinifera]|uniref:Uncharacterized protein n=1 Tax=Vitis vinifera TaxID=29760 RepID=A0A438CXY6_VITVI|nr:hypothetical protein CK203_097967 [Vitis vinifera]
MCLWRECWQISGIYGQPKRHRSQPGSSQSSHGDTSSQEQKELQRLTGKLVALGRFIARLLMSCDPSSWQYEKLERMGGRTIAKTLGKN